MFAINKTEIKPFLVVVVALLVFVLNFDDTAVAEDISNVKGNGSVVMKINEKNGTFRIRPKAMINQHVLKRKEKTKGKGNIKPIDNKSEEISKNINESSHLSFPYNLKIIKEVLDVLENEECVKDTVRVFEAMTRHEKWALEMFDSFPKFPVGILYGNYYQLGNFDECVGAKQIPNEEYVDETAVQGQYCLTDIHFKPVSSDPTSRINTTSSNTKTNRNLFNNTVIHWGICLPSTCTTVDAQIFTKEVFNFAAGNLEVVSVVVDENKCVYEKTQPISNPEIIYGAVVGSFLILSALATGVHVGHLRKRKSPAPYNVDSLRTQQPSVFKELIKCFSLLHTSGKFFSTKRNELNLECICGIKFLSMVMIIFGHSLVFIFGGPLENKKFITTENIKIENGQFLNNPLMVDTFLLVSGFLMCRLLLIELDKRKGKVNVIVLYIARYIRLTPAYLVVLGFEMTLFDRIGSGPFWDSRVRVEKQRCLNSWWKNILYVNNYLNDGYLCMFQSWYLAVDYHLFIVAPIIIYPLWRWRRFGEFLLFVCSTAAIGVPFWITYKDKLDPTLLAFAPEVEDISTNFYYLNVYIKTHMRAGSYCIGLLFGYLVHKIQSEGKKIPSCLIGFGWIMACSFSLISMYSIAIFFNPDHQPNDLENAIYSALHRIGWSVSIGWIIMVCITDNAATINKFLSWRPFIPLSRLTYCAYLANGFVEIFNMGVLRQPTYLSQYELACKLFGHICIIFSIAFLLCIIFESPIHSLEKILLTRSKVREDRHNASVKPLEEA